MGWREVMWESIDNPNAVEVEPKRPPADEDGRIAARVSELLAGWPAVRPADDPVAPGEAWLVITAHELTARVREEFPEADPASVMEVARTQRA